MSLEYANIPALIPVLVMLTGDERWLRGALRPGAPEGPGRQPDGGLPPEIQAEIRAAAAEAISPARCGCRAPVAPRSSVRMLERRDGGGGAARVRADDRRRARAGRPPTAGARDGPRGLPRDRRRRRRVGAGDVDPARRGRHPVRRRSSATTTVGGTWLENRYPGAGVDTPSHLYSFSFAPQRLVACTSRCATSCTPTSRTSPTASACASIRFGTEVRRAALRRGRAGVGGARPTADETLRANVVITAVGVFNTPEVPGDPGPATRSPGPSSTPRAGPRTST